LRLQPHAARTPAPSRPRSRVDRALLEWATKPLEFDADAWVRQPRAAADAPVGGAAAQLDAGRQRAAEEELAKLSAEKLSCEMAMSTRKQEWYAVKKQDASWISANRAHVSNIEALLADLALQSARIDDKLSLARARMYSSADAQQDDGEEQEDDDAGASDSVHDDDDDDQTG
jgi:hypothetical protein